MPNVKSKVKATGNKRKVNASSSSSANKRKKKNDGVSRTQTAAVSRGATNADSGRRVTAGAARRLGQVANNTRRSDRAVTGAGTRRNQQNMAKSAVNNVGQQTKGAVKQWAGSQVKNVSELMAAATSARAGAQGGRRGTGAYKAKTGGAGVVAQRGSNDRRTGAQKAQNRMVQADAEKKVKQLDVAQYKGAVQTSKSASKLIRSGSKDIQKAQENMGAVGKFFSDAYVGGVQFGLDVGLASLTGGAGAVGQKAMQVKTLAGMYNRAAGSAEDQAEQETGGKISRGRKLAYGQVVGGIEVGTEMISNVGSVLSNAFGKGFADDFTDRWIRKVVDKGSKQGIKDFKYAAAKFGATALGEGFEEMIAEGVEPEVANAIYAVAADEQTKAQLKNAGYSQKEIDKYMAKNHVAGDTLLNLAGNEYNSKSAAALGIVRAGGIGAVLGGALGAGGTIAETAAGKKIMNNQQIYGDNGMLDLARKAAKSEDKSDAAKAAAIVEQIETGRGIAAGQASELQGIVAKQQKADNDRLVTHLETADSEIKDRGLASPINEYGEYGEHGIKTYNEAKETASKTFADLSVYNTQEAQESRIPAGSEAIARISVGDADAEAVEMIVSDQGARQVFSAMTGIDLQGMTDTEARDAIAAQAAKNYVSLAEAETRSQKDKIDGRFKAANATMFGSEGQKAFSQVLGSIDTRALEDENAPAEEVSKASLAMNMFNMYYKAARAGMSYEEVNGRMGLTGKVAQALKGIMDEGALVTAFEAGAADLASSEKAVVARSAILGEKLKSDVKKNFKGGTVAVDQEISDQVSGADYDMLLAVARAFNLEIHVRDKIVYDGVERNGSYSNGVVELSLNNQWNNGEFSGLAFVLSHEITHHMEMFAPEEYQKLKQFTIEQAAKRGIDVDDYIAKYGGTYDRAMDEFVCDQTFAMIADPAFVETLCREDRSVAQKLLDAIRNAIGKLNEIIGSLSQEVFGGNLYVQMGVLEEARALWLDGLAKTIVNKDLVGREAVQVGDQRFSIYKSAIKELEQVKDGTFGDSSKNEVRIGTSSDFIVNTLGVEPFEVLMPVRKAYMAMVDPETAKEEKRYRVEDDDHYHGLGVKGLVRALYAAENPVIAFKSRDNSIVLITDQTNDAGEYIMMVQAIETSGWRKGKKVKTNKAISTYGKGKVQEYVRKMMSDESRILYADKKRSHLVCGGPELQLLDSRSYDFSDNISDFMEDVNSRRFSTKVVEPGQPISEGQAEYFRNSKVRDADGNLLLMYHGSSADFTVFDENKIGKTGAHEGTGFNFTPSEGRASSYKNEGGKVYEGYVNIERPLSAEKITITARELADIIAKIDPTGDNIIADYARDTHDYGAPSFVKREAMTTARATIDFAESDADIYSSLSAGAGGNVALMNAFKDLGYDGVIHYYDDGKIQTAVTFSPNQFKNADNVHPTENEDMRFSDKDAEYMAAAKAGDLVTCKRMVEEAAKKAGYTTRAYHGTQSYGFTVFDGMKKGYQNNIGSHFSPEYDTANDHFGYKSDFPGVAPGVYEVFLNTGNQYETFDWFGQDDFYPAAVAQELAEEIGTPEATEILNKIKGIKFDLTSGDGSPVMLGDTIEDTREVLEEGYVWGDEFYKENFSLLYDSIKQLMLLGGYDSIIYENGLEAPGEMDYIIWDPERIKSADPITYDGNGNIIPLSERFNDEENDIRWSTKEEQMDFEYLQAVERGDMETAQKLVDRAAAHAMPLSHIRDGNGKLVKQYHYTPLQIDEDDESSYIEPWYEFDINRAGTIDVQGFYFAPNEDEWFDVGADYTRTITAYLDIKNPFKLKSNLHNVIYWPDLYNEEGRVDPLKGFYDSKEYARARKKNDNAVGGAFRQWLLDNGYDGVIRADGVVVALNPEQIKSAEPVTYRSEDHSIDNVIPLSERFDFGTGDYRFSTKDPVEVQGEFVALHNLHARELFKALTRGGFPMPSIALTHKSNTHTGFGSCTVLFRRDTIDPEVNMDNMLYEGDAYTPVYPEVIDDVQGGERMQAIEDKVYEPGSMLKHRWGDFSGSLSTAIRKIAKGELFSTAGDYGTRNRITAKAAFLLDNGVEVPASRFSKWGLSVDELYNLIFEEESPIVRVLEDVDWSSRTYDDLIENVYDGDAVSAIEAMLHNAAPRAKAIQRAYGDRFDDAKANGMFWSDGGVYVLDFNKKKEDFMFAFRNIAKDPDAVAKELYNGFSDNEGIARLIFDFADLASVLQETLVYAKYNRSGEQVTGPIDTAYRAASKEQYVGDNMAGQEAAFDEFVDEVKADTTVVKSVENSAGELVPETLDNVLSAMELQEETANGARKVYSVEAGKKAAGGARYTGDIETIDDIYKAIDYLGASFNAAYKNAKTGLDFDYYSYNVDTAHPNQQEPGAAPMMGFIDDVENGRIDPKDYQITLTAPNGISAVIEGILGVGETDLDRFIESAKESLKEWKTADKSGFSFSESKPHRIVGTDEIAAIVMPEDRSDYMYQESAKRAQELGIPVYKYEHETDSIGGVLTDTRVDVINQAAEEQHAMFSTKDDTGRTLSSGQEEYFKNSKARDKNGRLVRVYHGTSTGGFTIFEQSDWNNQFFFTDDLSVAKTYQNEWVPKRYTWWPKEIETVEDAVELIKAKGWILRGQDTVTQREWVINVEDLLGDTTELDKFSVKLNVYEDAYSYEPIAEAYTVNDEATEDSLVEVLYEMTGRNTSRNRDEYAAQFDIGDTYYECYLDLQNPLIIDAGYRNWNSVGGSETEEETTFGEWEEAGTWIYNEIGPETFDMLESSMDRNPGEDVFSQPFTDYDGRYGAVTVEFKADYSVAVTVTYEGMSTREWCAQAQGDGYDGVIFRDIVDIGGGIENGAYASTVYVAFSPSQIKMTDNLNPTENPDIRFSTVTYEDSFLKPKVSVASGASAIALFTDENSKLAPLSKTGAEMTHRAMVDLGDWKESQWLNLNKFMLAMVKFMNKTQGTYKFIGLQDVQAAEIQVRKGADDKVASVVMSAMVANGEYAVNFDFTSICKKRQAMSLLVDKLTKNVDPDGNRLINAISIDAKTLWDINEALRAEGVETACLGCFVEARRYHIDNFTFKATTMWNRAVLRSLGYEDRWVKNGKTYTYDAAKKQKSFTRDGGWSCEWYKNGKKFAGSMEEAMTKSGQGYFDFADKIDTKNIDYEAVENMFSGYAESKGSKKSPAARMETMLSDKGKTPEQKKGIEKYRKFMRASDLITPEGIEGLKKISTSEYNMVGFMKSAYGTAAPKEVMAYTPYNSEIAMMPTEHKGQRIQDYLKSIAGVRMQSFSDFLIANVFDYFQIIADMAARGFVSHAYTKEIMFAKLFGLTGVKINMSLMFDVDRNLPAEYAGMTFVESKNGKETYNGKKGSWEYLVSDQERSDREKARIKAEKMAEGMSEEEAEKYAMQMRPYVQSISLREAVKLQRMPGYSKNVGTIAVGLSDFHIRRMMADDDIRFIIPYHKSGLPEILSKDDKTGLGRATNYEDCQNTRIFESVTDSNGKVVDYDFAARRKALGSWKAVWAELNGKGYTVNARGAKSEETDAHGKKYSLAGFSEFPLYEDLETTKSPEQTVENYADWCLDPEKNGTGTVLIPLFDRFLDEDNFYKVLYDFDVKDHEGNYAPQQPVQNIYPGNKNLGNPQDMTEDGAKWKALQDLIEEEMQERETENMHRDEVVDDLARKFADQFNWSPGEQASAEVDRIENEPKRFSTKMLPEPQTFKALPAPQPLTELAVVPTDYLESIAREDEIMSELHDAAKYIKQEHKPTGGNILDEKSVKEPLTNLVAELMQNSNTTKKVNRQIVGMATNGCSVIFRKLGDSNLEGAGKTAFDTARKMVEKIALIGPNEAEEFPEIMQSEEAYLLMKDLAFDLMGIAYSGQAWYSTADKKIAQYEVKTKVLKAKYQAKLEAEKQKTKEAKAEGREKERAAKAAGKESTKQAKAEGREKVRETRTKERAKASDRIREMRAREDAKRDSRSRSALQKKIKKQLTWFNNMLMKPTDDKHLPDGYRKLIAQLLASIDTQTKRSRDIENQTGHVSKARADWLELKSQWEAIAKDEETRGYVLDPEIADMIQAIADRGQELTGEGRISELSVDELDALYRMLRGIRHAVTMQNQNFSDGLKQGPAERGEAIMEELYNRKHSKASDIPFLNEYLNSSIVTPRDFFEYMGEGMMESFLNLRKGFDVHIGHIAFMRSFFGNLFYEYGNKKKPGSEIENWRNDKYAHDFDLELGGSIRLAPSQVMSLYCLMKRKQAQEHILSEMGGHGIVASDINTSHKIKEMFIGHDKSTSGKAFVVTFGDVMNIIDSLTPEQMEIADKLQDLLNTEIAQWGNETSMRMFGYHKFTEKNYFPIECESTYLATDFDVRNTAERIKNPGFGKATTPHASNPVVIGDIFEAVADHCNRMSMYHAFAPAIADFQRTYNYKATEGNGSVKEAIRTTYNNSALKYIERFMTDLNGTTDWHLEGLTKLVSKSLANYKKAAIGGNIRVALQQPTAMIRAFALIDPKYFVGLSNPLKEMREMQTHCPIALWKSWGFSQVDMARSLEDIMMNQEWSRIDVVTMEIYGALDNVTWGQIWAAVKKETAAKHKDVEYGSEKFWEICSERATEIFDKTQVVDSVFHRSQMMRNNDPMSKTLTAFMAEPTRTFNMLGSELMKAIDLAKQGKKGEAAKVTSRILAVFILNAATVSAAAAIADMIRGKVPGGSGDDDDKGVDLERWFLNFIANFKDNADPVNMLPFFKEFKSYWEGWEPTNMAMEGWSDLISAIKDFKDSDDSLEQKIVNIAEGFGYVTGLPVKNILREIESLASTFGLAAPVHALDNAESANEISAPDRMLQFLGWNKKIQDGSTVDNALNFFGINMTDQERAAAELNEQLDYVRGKTEGLTGQDKQDKVWEAITRADKDHGKPGLQQLCYNGDVKEVKEMRKLLAAAGGDVDKFDETVMSYMKTGYKKTIGADTPFWVQPAIYEYLVDHGMTQQDISNEVLYHTETAHNLKVAFCAMDVEKAKEELGYLKAAGLTYDDFMKLWDNRYRGVKPSEYLTPNKKGWVTPTTGTITSHFGARSSPTAGASSYHQAIDIGASSGTKVVAAKSGVVESAGYAGGYGKQIVINHGDGTKTYYSHLSWYEAQNGDKVKQGQYIGNVGSTGVSTGPHLDFKISMNGQFVDPEKYLSIR